MLLHVFALQPGHDITGRFFCTSLCHGASFTKGLHAFKRVSEIILVDSAQYMFDRTMNHQIRVAPDWWCKVSILRERKAKVTFVFGLVHSLLHRSEHHGLNHQTIRSIFDFATQGSIVKCRRWVSPAYRQWSKRQKRFQIFKAIGFRPVVHAIQGWNFMMFQISSRCDIRQDHAFFYQLVRVISHHWHNLADLLLIIKQNSRLGRFKLNSTTSCANTCQGFIQAM